MKRTSTLLTALLTTTVVGLALSGCSSTDSGGGGGQSGSGKIGVILPDTKSSVRWESKDRPALEAAFKEAGVEYTIQNAEGSADQMATIADGMIADGVTVLAIVNLDSDSGASIQQKAATQGVKTIDYDRLTLGGSADVYVSFDNTKVGELQGQGLVDCLAGKPANVVFLNGSPTDNNATLFSAGAHSVIDATPTITIVGEQAVPDWDNDKAVTIFEQLNTAADGKIDGVLRGERRPCRVGHLDPGEEQARGAGAGHRAGRHRRRPAEHPGGHAVHDGVQIRDRRGRRAGRRGDRTGRRAAARDQQHFP